jgi:hypothetical protein
VSVAGRELPTLVVGLGAFGAEVCEKLPPAARVLTAEAGATPTQTSDRLVEQAEELLRLGNVIEVRAPGDARRPALDLLFVGDLGEPEVAQAIAPLVDEAGKRLLKRFSHIFRGHDLGNLTLCPILAMTGMRKDGAEAEPARKALAALEAIAKRGAEQAVPRVLVIEEQSSRYELERGELVSTVLALLALVLDGSLRHAEPLASFLRAPPGELRDGRIFGSFGCATLELSLGRYCVARAAAELAESLARREGAEAGESVSRAERLVPEPDDSQTRLASPESGDDLLALLRAQVPQVEFPEIAWSHTPEQIRDVNYGWGWFDALERTVSSLVTRLDEQEMDELARVADERGLALRRRSERDLRQRIRELERSGPRGWSAALRLAEQVQGVAERRLSRLERELKAAELPPFPKTDGVESAFRALREESTRRPRPYRLLFFGVLATLALAAMLHHLPKWLLVVVGMRRVPPLAIAPSSMDVDVGAARWFVDPPWVFFWLVAVIGVVVGMILSRHRKQRHEALLDARDDLRAAVRRYLNDDVGASVRRYYESRLVFSLRSWAYRILRRLREVAGAEAERLGRISLALGKLERELGAEVRRAERPPERGPGDLLYRTRVTPELLQSTYEAVRPASDLAVKLFGEIEAPKENEPPEYLFAERLLEFVEPEVKPRPEVLAERAAPFVVEFVSELAGKLGAPLEVAEFDDRAAERQYLFAPAWAEGAVREAERTIGPLPDLLPHGDPDRVHLVSLRTALTRGSIAVLAGKGTPAHGGS